MIYLKELYDTEKKHFHSQIRRDLVYEMVKAKCPEFKQNSKIIDVGCASGTFLEHLNEKGYKNLCGIDPNPASIEFIRRNLPDICLYDLYLKDYLYQEKKKFDFVFLLDVLEHIEEDQTFLSEVNDLLYESGKVIISVPAYQWLWCDHDKMHNHYRRYSMERLNQLLDDCGYEVEFCSYYSTILFPLVILQKMISKIKKYEDHKSFLPSPFLNMILKTIYKQEIPLLKKISFPFGSSLICFASKKRIQLHSSSML